MSDGFGITSVIAACTVVGAGLVGGLSIAWILEESRETRDLFEASNRPQAPPPPPNAPGSPPLNPPPTARRLQQLEAPGYRHMASAMRVTPAKSATFVL